MNLKVKLLITLAVVIFLLIGSGTYLMIKNGVFADVNNTGVLAKGTHLVPGILLTDSSLSKSTLPANLTIYSYNDVSNPGDKWTMYKSICPIVRPGQTPPVVKCVTTMNFDSRLAYVVVNSGSSSYKIQKSVASQATSNKSRLSSGKYLTYWNLGDTKVRYFRNALKFSFVDGKEYTFVEAWRSGYITGKIWTTSVSNGSNLITTPVETKLVGNASMEIKNNTFFFINVRESHPVSSITLDKNYVSGLATANINLLSEPVKIGLNLGSGEGGTFNLGSNANLDILSDISNLGINSARIVNFDINGQDDVQIGSNLAQKNIALSGNFFLMGNVRPGYGYASEVGKGYANYSGVIDDIKLYSGHQLVKDEQGKETYIDIPADWEKVKNLLKYHYFAGNLVPRLNAYKQNIKFWQVWNEPDGSLNTRFAIPAEVLSLITTGKVIINGEEIGFKETDKIPGTNYSLQHGAGGSNGVIKQICSDCKVVSAGFFKPNEKSGYFETLRDNAYEDSIDVNEVHLNLFPDSTMNYTKYWTDFTRIKRIYDVLCGGSIDKCNKPLWSTEIGSQSDTNYKNSDTNTTYSMIFSQNFQADDVVKRLVSFSGFGITNLSWNGYISDFSGNCEMVGDNNTSNCTHKQKALYTFNGSSYTKRPVYDSFKYAISQLKNASSVDLLSEIDETHKQQDQVFLYMVVKADGKKEVVGWCEPFWNKTSPTGSWNYDNENCSKEISLEEYDVVGHVTISDKLGNRTNGLANKITLTKSPQYISEWTR